jgi:hypothetical protein
MEEFPFRIFANLEDHRIQALTDPADGAELLWNISALVEVIRMRKDLLCFLEADSTLRIPPKASALPLVEVESYEV